MGRRCSQKEIWSVVVAGRWISNGLGGVGGVYFAEGNFVGGMAVTASLFYPHASLSSESESLMEQGGGNSWFGLLGYR